MKKIIHAVLLLVASVSVSAVADDIRAQGVTLGRVAVNGGTDASNVGVTCISVNQEISTKCGSSYVDGKRMVAIRNNNKELIATAIAAKSFGSVIDLYYSEESGSNHCPGHTFTTCVVSSIDIK